MTTFGNQVDFILHLTGEDMNYLLGRWQDDTQDDDEPATRRIGVAIAKAIGAFPDGLYYEWRSHHFINADIQQQPRNTD